MTPRLLLFDIDGTLIHRGRMGSTALRRAFLELHRLEDALAGLHLDGKTDPGICREVFERHALPWSEAAWQSVQRSYLLCLELVAAQEASGRPCPGVPRLLDTLSRRSDCVLGLLTGNVRRGAEIKLRVFGLWDYFEFGAFGCDRERRVELVEVALRRGAELRDTSFSAAETVVVGDTPADIETARHGGCVAVAVATGRFAVEELARHRPDVLLEDLGDLDAALQAFGLEPPVSAAR